MAANMRYTGVGMVQKLKQLNIRSVSSLKNIPSLTFSTSSVNLKDKSKCLLVQRLPKSISNERLLKYFEEFGKVEQLYRPLSLYDNKHAVVQFKNAEDARQTVKEMGFLESIKLSKANPEVVVVKNLRKDATQDTVKEYFSKYGEISFTLVKMKVMRFAFVHFENSDITKAVAKQKILKIDDKEVKVKAVVSKVVDSDEPEQES